MPIPNLLTSKTAVFALGAVSVPLLNALVPAIGTALRPVLKEVIKGSIVAGRAIQTVAQEAWQDVEDLTAEVHEELNNQEKNSNGTATKTA